MQGIHSFNCEVKDLGVFEKGFGTELRGRDELPCLVQL
jgi:hypothetical protein